MKDTRKGFTLVELLAVIVILAIIMIIAIPSVLQTMTTAQQKTFVEYVTRVYEAGQNQYLTQKSSGTLPTGATSAGSGAKIDKYYVYDITKDVGLSSTGSYKGYVVIEPASGQTTSTKIYVMLYDNEYMTTGNTPDTLGFVEYTSYGEPKVSDIAAASGTSDASDLIASDSITTNLGNAKVAAGSATPATPSAS